MSAPATDAQSESISTSGEDSQSDDGFNPQLDLDNFPDPGKYFCLVSHNITTEEEFKAFWYDYCGKRITRFESFTTWSPDKAA